MILLVGLGNPGKGYVDNRHNFGFMAVDEIIRRHSFSPGKIRFQGVAAEGRIGAEKILALKPTTFMNESGRSVGEAVRFYKIPPENVIVIYDELDLPMGKVRVKKGGGHGGNNGIRSVEAHLGKEFYRVRLGIGHPGDKALVSGHVLKDFSKADRKVADTIIDSISRHIELMTSGRDSEFMNKVALDTVPQRQNAEQKIKGK